MNIITMDTIYYVLGIIVFIAVRIAFDREHQIDLVLAYFALFAVTFYSEM